jgi:antitoxin component YwqK of YwqJK toxin-antitoxin module
MDFFKKITLIIATCLVVSCDKGNKVIEYYQNGNLKSVYIYENGLKQDSSVHYYEHNKGAIKYIKYWKNDSTYYEKDFFENGKLMREGKLLRDGFRIGKWHLYSPSNYKVQVIEYFNINNTSYLNQSWKLNSRGDTILGGNFYQLIHFQDTLYDQPGRTHFMLRQRLLEGELFVCLPKKGMVIEEDFSNEYEIDWDTINNISREYVHDPRYRNVKYDVLFGLTPKKKGHNFLRGFLLEREDVRHTDTLDFITRKIYFNIPYYVK